MKKRIVIYCASGYGERAMLALNELDYEVIGFVDSNPECQNRCLYGGGICKFA